MTTHVDTRQPSTVRSLAPTVLAWVGLAGRLYLGYTFIKAGLDKLPHPDGTEAAVRAYQLLPWQWASSYATALPVAELVLGIALALGLFTRSVAVLLALGLCSFLVGITSAWARGLNIDCGCFGGGGEVSDPHYLEHVLRDAGYLAIATYLVVVRRTALAAGDWLFGRRD
ncbi:DoxX family protein [Nocardioides cheoyonin]|uniref:DoxX family protein n=1 Tax=Nocardioides cheoyonin TaxID=3156615 RepID=UPI0032B48F43